MISAIKYARIGQKLDPISANDWLFVTAVQGKPPPERQTAFHGTNTRRVVPAAGLTTAFTITWSSLQ